MALRKKHASRVRMLATRIDALEADLADARSTADAEQQMRLRALAQRRAEASTALAMRVDELELRTMLSHQAHQAQLEATLAAASNRTKREVESALFTQEERHQAVLASLAAEAEAQARTSAAALATAREQMVDIARQGQDQLADASQRVSAAQARAAAAEELLASLRALHKDAMAEAKASAEQQALEASRTLSAVRSELQAAAREDARAANEQERKLRQALAESEQRCGELEAEAHRLGREATDARARAADSVARCEASTARLGAEATAAKARAETAEAALDQLSTQHRSLQATYELHTAELRSQCDARVGVLRADMEARVVELVCRHEAESSDAAAEIARFVLLGCFACWAVDTHRVRRVCACVYSLVVVPPVFAARWTRLLARLHSRARRPGRAYSVPTTPSIASNASSVTLWRATALKLPPSPLDCTMPSEAWLPRLPTLHARCKPSVWSTKPHAPRSWRRSGTFTRSILLAWQRSTNGSWRRHKLPCTRLATLLLARQRRAGRRWRP